MLLSQKKRKVVDCLPAKVVLTVSGKQTGDMTAYAYNTNAPHDCTPLTVSMESGEACLTLPESMACNPGVWTLCLLDSCIECGCVDIELANECVITSVDVESADPDLEEKECPCP